MRLINAVINGANRTRNTTLTIKGVPKRTRNFIPRLFDGAAANYPSIGQLTKRERNVGSDPKDELYYRPE